MQLAPLTAGGAVMRVGSVRLAAVRAGGSSTAGASGLLHLVMHCT